MSDEWDQLIKRIEEERIPPKIAFIMVIHNKKLMVEPDLINEILCHKIYDTSYKGKAIVFYTKHLVIRVYKDDVDIVTNIADVRG